MVDVRAAVAAPMGSPRVEERSIAVLPFDNLSPDPENEFFAYSSQLEGEDP